MPDEVIQPSSFFPETPWSVLLRGQDGTGARGREMLTVLCQNYWYPLYSYFRRRVDSVEQAEDYTQEFFARFIEKEYLSAVDPAKGKFRCYLLACGKHFLSNQRDYEKAQKRGGGKAPLSLDFQSADTQYRLEPAIKQPPEEAFDRTWALTLINRVFAQLQKEYRERGKEQLYERLERVFLKTEAADSYAQIGAQFDMTEDAVKKSAQRLRRRYREVITEHIAQTVETSEQVDEEIRDLFAALAR